MAFENSTDAIRILEGPRNRERIEDVKREESQLRVFTENYTERDLRSEYYYNRQLLVRLQQASQSKYERTKQFFRYPLPTVELADAVLNDFFRIFEGKNRFFDVTAERSINRLKDWITNNDPALWIEENIRDVFKNKPNSFVVVDADENGPYLINIDSERLVDVSFRNKEGDLNYIAFIHSRGRDEAGQRVTYYAVYDDEYYRVFSKTESDGIFVLQREVRHRIGYCPAHSFIFTPSNDKNYLKRRVAFTDSLSRLEDYTVFDVYANYVDHYAPFPITEAPENPCTNNDCQDGWIIKENVIDPASGETERAYSECPMCNGGKDKGKFIGPGLHIGVKVSSDPNQNDGSGVFKMHFPETDKLEYLPKKLENLSVAIKNATVGVNGMVSTEAINELQARGGFESMESVMIRNKKELDRIYKWVVATVGRFFYRDLQINVEANFGTEFYLVSEEELQKRFEQAKEIGLPISELLLIYRQLLETKYRTNRIRLAREEILIDLDPFPLRSLDETITLKNESVIDDFELSLKANFLKFIQRFENENGSIVEFGSDLLYSRKIEIIENQLYLYNQQLIDQRNRRQNPENNGDGNEVSQEQREAQARLKGSVGGVQGLILLQQGVAAGTTDRSAAIETLIEIYGLNRDKAEMLLGTPMVNPQQINNNLNTLNDGSNQNPSE